MGIFMHNDEFHPWRQIKFDKRRQRRIVRREIAQYRKGFFALFMRDPSLIKAAKSVRKECGGCKLY